MRSGHGPNVERRKEGARRHQDAGRERESVAIAFLLEHAKRHQRRGEACHRRPRDAGSPRELGVAEDARIFAEAPQDGDAALERADRVRTNRRTTAGRQDTGRNDIVLAG